MSEVIPLPGRLNSANPTVLPARLTTPSKTFESWPQRRALERPESPNSSWVCAEILRISETILKVVGSKLFSRF